MPKVIENITDETQFEAAYNKHFHNRSAYIKTSEMNISVNFKSYREGKVTLSIENSFDETDGVLFAKIDNDRVVYSKLSYIRKIDDHSYIFKPESIHIVDATRKEERKGVDSKNKGNIYISNIISDFTIKDCLSNQHRKVDFIRDKIIQKLSDKFKYARVYFPGDKNPDKRLMYFYSKRVPIFNPNKNDEEYHKKDTKFYKFYNTSLHQSDKKLDWKGLISEISVPLMYKMMFPFGYIQINHNAVLSEDDYSSVRKLGSSFSEVFSKNDIIKTSDDKILITDLSKNGLGIVFKERSLIKHFKDGSYIFFNIFMPDNKTVSVVCIIRNINFIKNSIFKVGCELIEMDALGETYYDELIES
ncbi:hypothetical protein ACFL20_01845 [Spirochaetota bacterium]